MILGYENEDKDIIFTDKYNIVAVWKINKDGETYDAGMPVIRNSLYMLFDFKKRLVEEGLIRNGHKIEYKRYAKGRLVYSFDGSVRTGLDKSGTETDYQARRITEKRLLYKGDLIKTQKYFYINSRISRPKFIIGYKQGKPADYVFFKNRSQFIRGSYGLLESDLIEAVGDSGDSAANTVNNITEAISAEIPVDVFNHGCFIAPCSHFAAYRGNPAILLRIIESGADINERDSYGRPIIFPAIQGGKIAVIDLLFKMMNIDPNMMLDKEPLILRAWDYGVIDYLYKKGAVIREDDIYAGIRYGNIELARFMIKNRIVDVNWADSDGRTLLMRVLCGRNDRIPGMTRMLLDEMADVHAKDRENRTALMYAVMEPADAHIVQLLLDAGSDVSVKDNKGNSILKFLECSNHAAAIQLIRAGCLDPCVFFDYAHSPEVIGELLQKGVNANITDESGMTPFMAAIRQGCAESAKLLAAAGADANVVTKKGNAFNVYMESIFSSTSYFAFVLPDMALFLASLKIDANVFNAEGLSPLMIFSSNVYRHWKGHKMNDEFLSVLENTCKAGADPFLRNKDGKNAFDFSNSQITDFFMRKYSEEYKRRNSK